MVSVVVPAHDAAATLPEALASIAAQTCSDFELIVVDDGSSDATGDIARAAGARVLRNETALGPGAARNRGVREARGELFALLDADDTWRPAYLERQLAVLAANPGASVVCCDADLVGPDLEPLGLTFHDRVGRVDRIDLDALLRENYVFGRVLCCRADFLAVGGFDEHGLGAEDYDLWLRMAEHGYRFVFNPEVLATYRLHPGALSAQVEGRARDAAVMMERALERGALSRRQRRIARRRRRMFRLVEARARIAPMSGPRRAAEIGRLLPALTVAILQHPDRWRAWLRRGVRPAGADRHTDGSA